MSRGQKKFLTDLSLSLVFGVVVVLAIWFAQAQIGEERTVTLAISILTGMIAAYGVFMCITKYDDYRTLSGALDDQIARILVDNPYSSLINRQLQLHWQLSGVFRSIVDEYASRRGGAIVVEARSDEYLKKLESCLEYGKQSFEAIMRGGQMLLYRPRWFFYNEEKPDYSKPPPKDANGRVKMAERKRVYLEHVNKAKFNLKVRIMIFPKSILLEDFRDVDIREQYLETNSNVELYWLPQEDAERVLAGGDRHWGEVWNQYLQDDFAIIDSLVLKHVTLLNGGLL
ncbi:MAG: hypothetical protein HYY45_20035, partial [Deltaproteobacteria bacterium]|nr:hypothetical protein [Deltaproteobacteria bacterium]